MATADLGPLGHQPPPAQAWDSVLIRRSTSEVQEGPDALRLLALQVLLGYRPSSQLAKKNRLLLTPRLHACRGHGELSPTGPGRTEPAQLRTA